MRSARKRFATTCRCSRASQPICVNDLISELEDALGKKAIRNHLPLQPGDVDRTYADVPGDVDRTYADVARAEKELGYRRTTDIRTGLAQFVAWLRQDA